MFGKFVNPTSATRLDWNALDLKMCSIKMQCLSNIVAISLILLQYL